MTQAVLDIKKLSTPTIKNLGKSPLKVIELFAGVGGFRLGLKEPFFEVVWANQWEPATKTQHAFDIYAKRFKSTLHSNEDISTISIKDIPDHDLLVGGFPCQDYSVARTSKEALGIVGKKGVLWWEIHRILKNNRNKPKYLLLENVDRLLKSPTKQRGRDFAIMLSSLSDLGYAVEWRIINAADYGFPQRRRRVFFFGYHETTNIYKTIERNKDLSSWVFKDGVIVKSFPVKGPTELIYPVFHLDGDLVEITDTFNKEKPYKSPFENSGLMIKRNVLTIKTYADYKGRKMLLKDILLPDEEIPEEYYINESDIPKWKYLKGAKNLLQKSKKTGKTFKYDEGAMVFPDDLNKPSRTIVTGEGGSTPSRFKHVVRGKGGRLRRLTPIELERLNMFPDNHTAGLPSTKRAFLMGNALVVGIIEKLGKGLVQVIKECE